MVRGNPSLSRPHTHSAHLYPVWTIFTYQAPHEQALSLPRYQIFTWKTPSSHEISSPSGCQLPAGTAFHLADAILKEVPALPSMPHIHRHQLYPACITLADTNFTQHTLCLQVPALPCRQQGYKHWLYPAGPAFYLADATFTGISFTQQAPALPSMHQVYKHQFCPAGL